MSNRDIALFNPGRTPITIDTFNFTRYGLLRGQLLTLSQDVVMHDLQFRSEHFRSVPKTCRTAGHRLNLPEAGAELSGGSIFRWCVSLNFSKAGPTTGTPRAGLAKIAQDRAADAVLGTGLLLFSLRAGYWRRGAGTATAHIGLYCRGGPSGLLGRTFPTMSGAPQPTSTRAERGKPADLPVEQPTNSIRSSISRRQKRSTPTMRQTLVLGADE
ncbi:MAG: hypothetical protein QOI46_3559 [Alphaproteobacteria bacterium]|nr:hypothetical protein [Alphaproteobacteria bacterium]